jgi:hypothetical protein
MEIASGEKEGSCPQESRLKERRLLAQVWSLLTQALEDDPPDTVLVS